MAGGRGRELELVCPSPQDQVAPLDFVLRWTDEVRHLCSRKHIWVMEQGGRTIIHDDIIWRNVSYWLHQSTQRGGG